MLNIENVSHTCNTIFNHISNASGFGSGCYGDVTTIQQARLRFVANHSPGKSLLLANPSTAGGACLNTGVKTFLFLPTSPFCSDCHVTAKTTQAVAAVLNFLPGSVHSTLGTGIRFKPLTRIRGSHGGNTERRDSWRRLGRLPCPSGRCWVALRCGLAVGVLAAGPVRMLMRLTSAYVAAGAGTRHRGC